MNNKVFWWLGILFSFIILPLNAYTSKTAFGSFEPTEIPTETLKISYFDSTDQNINKVREIISKINIGATNPKFNGSVLIGYKGKILFAQSYGVANRESKLKNDLNLPTQVASITKTFTGTAVVWLAQKGFLQLDDQVQQYLPEFPYFGITIEQLLNHRSGLPDYINFPSSYWTEETPMYNQDVLSQFVNKSFKLRFDPGTRHSYSNTNYAMLALIIERVTNMSYKNFMNRYIFEPMQMENSFVYDPTTQYLSPLAKSYNAHFTPWKENHEDGVYGDKGIFTTPIDLYKWDKALYSNDFVNKDSKSKLFQPHVGNKVKNYGLGWRIKLYPTGKKFVYHTGWWHGYQGIFSRYLDDEFTIIVTSNRYISGISENSEEMYYSALPYFNLTDLTGTHQTKIADEEEAQENVEEVVEEITVKIEEISTEETQGITIE